MKIKDAPVYKLADIAAEAQAQVQAQYPQLDPVIAISHQLRASGFAADTLTVQSTRYDQRLLIVLHDARPNEVDYEFSRLSEEAPFAFSVLPLVALDLPQFVRWMTGPLAQG
ncbi:hypothetical protein EDC56_3010 [Sinobacterium caligoides]|uniref:Uncharacterized protein n=1 Tax=Sinobacterium caligoides TaxID=933926 RepID=A0A3N2DL00_9GAMM|nr:hypothetical protein [Sinobacterium caligoides]ROS00359.1 hypothetical protein EDC56_3010 [Sinobacterium caligoides]